MFSSKPPAEKTGLEVEIDRVLNNMKEFAAEDPEYAKCSRQLARLYKLKQIDKPKRVDPDTMALIAGNILVTVVIVGHERAHIITTKALQFLPKLR